VFVPALVTLVPGVHIVLTSPPCILLGGPYDVLVVCRLELVTSFLSSYFVILIMPSRHTFIASSSPRSSILLNKELARTGCHRRLSGMSRAKIVI
jgi:hypothetical protein